jgi:hypothetical protein
MSGFVEGIDRSQSTFFPAMLDDYVAKDNLVRAVDAFVEGLELGKLGFGRVAPLEKGRPSHIPSRPRTEAWSYVATGLTPVRVALSNIAAPPARND